MSIIGDRFRYQESEGQATNDRVKIPVIHPLPDRNDPGNTLLPSFHPV